MNSTEAFGEMQEVFYAQGRTWVPKADMDALQKRLEVVLDGLAPFVSHDDQCLEDMLGGDGCTCNLTHWIQQAYALTKESKHDS